MENTEKRIRNIVLSRDFLQYYNALDECTKDKYVDSIKILEEVYVLSTKFVKRLVSTKENLYELRVSIGFNEHRSILFSANHENIIQATEIVILTGFLKKSTKDYDKQIKRAINILNTLKL
ncbi:MAG: type II toxin-antitoxin system RelE/ParE family toxin [Dysgonamonadaceae bacterium]|jgi:hypothetical protein|nr:type II toxin-antitoxin system RelE/ParE family toxin [Dysgonamonadaceae bacterium]